MPTTTLLHKVNFARVKQAADARTLIFEVSNSEPDRDSDVLPVSQWDTAAYRRNPIVLFGHDRGSLPVGKCTKLWVKGNRLMAAIEFATHEQADTVFQLCKQGFLSATSVAFKPSTSERNSYGGITYNGPMELLEISIVPIPANSSALIQARAVGINLEPVLKWFPDVKEDSQMVLEIYDAKSFVSCPKGGGCPHRVYETVESCPMAHSGCPLWESSSGNAIVVLPDWRNLIGTSQSNPPRPSEGDARPSVPAEQQQPGSWSQDILNPKAARRFAHSRGDASGFYDAIAERGREWDKKHSAFDPFSR